MSKYPNSHYTEHCYVQIPKVVQHLNWTSVPVSADWEGLTVQARTFRTSFITSSPVGNGTDEMILRRHCGGMAHHHCYSPKTVNIMNDAYISRLEIQKPRCQLLRMLASTDRRPCEHTFWTVSPGDFSSPLSQF